MKDNFGTSCDFIIQFKKVDNNFGTNQKGKEDTNFGMEGVLYGVFNLPGVACINNNKLRSKRSPE